MPSWVDLTEHHIALNVTQTPDGKRLLLRPTDTDVDIPRSVEAMGFTRRGEFYERSDLKFALADILVHFPKAISRDIPLQDILYVPARQAPAAVPAATSESDVPDGPQSPHPIDAVPLDQPDEPRSFDTFRFESSGKSGGRPAATALLRLMQTGAGLWTTAIDMRHHQGSHLGRMHTYGEEFHTREAALMNVLALIVRDQNDVLSLNAGSMVTDGQRRAAREMKRWALTAALPPHRHTHLESGTYAGWHRVDVESGPLQRSFGLGVDLDAARESLRLQIVRKLKPESSGSRPIGENPDGQPVFEDSLGVRSVIADGVRRTEKVQITPHGVRLAIDERSLEYLTRAELAELRGPETGPQVSSSVGRPGEATGGMRIDATIDDVPVHLDVGNGPSAVAYALLDGEWRRLGEAWPERPTDSELRIAIGAARTPSIDDTFDSDRIIAGVNAEIAANNAAVSDAALRRPLVPDDMELRRIDDSSMEVHFRDPDQPFSIRIEQSSAGVYRSIAGSAASAPRLSLNRAVEWSANHLADQRNAYNAERRAADPAVPELMVDAASFAAFFGSSQSGSDTLARLREYAEDARQADAGDQRPRFMSASTFFNEVPPNLTATWPDKHTLELGLADAEPSLAIQLRPAAPENGGPLPYVAAGAVGVAIVKLQAEMNWQRTKADRPDAGASLDDVSRKYAAFMHERSPDVHSGQVGDMHRRFAIALVDRDVDHIISWIARAPGQNDLSKKFFAQHTGTKLPRTARDIKWRIYEWAGFELEEAKRIDAEKIARRAEQSQQQSAEREFDYLVRSLEATQVRHNGVVKTAKAFLDEIIDDGFTKLETHKVGAVNRYRLVNEPAMRSYSLRGNQVDYVRQTLQNRLQLAAADEPVQRPELQLRPSFALR
ncbi:hypothetical protein [Paraburkholderia sediminicola]|uniref:hypothetical protein n=1 Tax=Paraburkholderia sediminicola TaxID=458836 RepID=UPI0038BCBF90